MLTRLYRSLYRIRRVEEEIARVYSTDKIKSPVHLSIGQEAVSVGVCESLLPHDVVFGQTYTTLVNLVASTPAFCAAAFAQSPNRQLLLSYGTVTQPNTAPVNPVAPCDSSR